MSKAVDLSSITTRRGKRRKGFGTKSWAGPDASPGDSPPGAVVFEVSPGREAGNIAVKKVLPPLERVVEEAKSHGDVVKVVISRKPKRLAPSTGGLAERMLPEAPVPSPAQALLARREAEARWGLLEEFGAFTSEQIADNRSRAKNRHALANRWRSEGKIFAVELRGQRLYPGFQFDPETFAPLPAVAAVLGALPRAEMSDWEVGLWWVAGNDRLAGRRPVDVLAEDPVAIVEAAAGLAEPSSL